MTAKDYLRRIRQLDAAADAAQLELESIESTATRMTARYGGCKVAAGDTGHSTMIDAVARLYAARERCNNAIDEYINYREHCRDLIALLPNPLHRAVLIGRYVAYQKLDDLADSMHYSRRQICYIHGAALAAFEKLIPNAAADVG